MRLSLKRAKRQAADDRPGAAAGERPPFEDPLAAIDELTAHNREHPDADTERRLVYARHAAYDELDRTGPSSRPPEQTAEVPGVELEIDQGLPSVPADALDARAVRAGILSHGSVLIRGLVDEGDAGELAAGIDEAFAARDAHRPGSPAAETSPWFEPFEPDPRYETGRAGWNRMKKGGGSVWAADSPRMLYALLEQFERTGLTRLVTDYLGERPAFSMDKIVLRRVSPETGTDWHQDGAFLGEGIRTLNVWIALNHCGRDAPGLDVVPLRLDEIVETGTEGAIFPWAVSPAKVDELLQGQRPARPIFEPGDAILFDHLCLHRTAVEPEMNERRYATESWCFAPSCYPDGKVPFVV